METDDTFPRKEVFIMSKQYKNTVRPTYETRQAAPPGTSMMLRPDWERFSG